MEDLQIAFNPLHAALSKKYGHSYGPKDFVEAIKVLEGSFIGIHGGRVSFINPSVRDYLTEYLNDRALLADFTATAQSANWAKELWKHYRDHLDATADGRAEFARLFIPLGLMLKAVPVWKTGIGSNYPMRTYDMWNASRLELLLEWWDAAHNEEFGVAALALAANPPGGYRSYLDADTLANLIAAVKDRAEDGFPEAELLCEHLEAGLIGLVRDGIASDDLVKVCDIVNEESTTWSQDVHDAITDAIQYEFSEIASIVAQIDSESTLNDHADSLQKLGRRANAAPFEIQDALQTINDRIEEIRDEAPQAKSPKFSGSTPFGKDECSDQEIRDLFLGLVS